MICRIVLFSRHLKNPAINNAYLNIVTQHEEQSIMRIADRLTENSVKSDNNIPPPMLQKKEVKENHYKTRPNKVQHDNLQNSRTRAAHVNKELTEK